MTSLTIYSVDAPSIEVTHETEFGAIAAALKSWGVVFGHLPATPLSAEVSSEQILAHFQAEVDQLKATHGYITTDVVRLPRGVANAEALRGKFLSEHTHADDEARFFVEGQGAFYLRNDTTIVKIICTQGDLIIVPKGTRHWFDMGPDPYFTAIRLFTDPEGWVGHFTGDPIADAVPRFDG